MHNLQYTKTSVNRTLEKYENSLNKHQFNHIEQNNIPKDWKLVNLEDIATLHKGISYSSEDYCDKNQGYIFLTLKAVNKNGGFNKNGIKYYNGNTENKDFLKSKDIVIANTDLTRDGDVIGCPIEVPIYDRNICISMDLTKISILNNLSEENKLHKQFLYYYLHHPYCRKFMKSHSSGTTVLHLDVKAVNKLKIPFPPYYEQKNIANILSKVDYAIENAKNAINKTENLKNGLMQELLTKGIGHNEFKNTEIGHIPKVWNIVKLGDIINTVKGKKPSNIFDQNLENTIPYLTAETMRSNSNTKWCKKEDSNIVRVFEDDLLMIWDGSYSGNVFTGYEGALASTMIKIDPSNNIKRKFLYYFLNTKFHLLKETTTGTSVPHVSKNVFLGIQVLQPSISEQEKIIDILSTVDKKIELEQKHLKQLKIIKSGLIQQLFTGIIRVGGI